MTLIIFCHKGKLKLDRKENERRKKERKKDDGELWRHETDDQRERVKKEI
jgi:hypothetical protein